GDSLKAMVLIKRLKKEFNINIPLKDFFQKQNIKELAEYIDNIIWLKTETVLTKEIII
ncbi:acyl carrier protein, partial [Mucilaginibacter angelicae]